MSRDILLVEDNSDDETLTLRTLKNSRVLNPVTIARDGAEAVDLLIGDRATPFALVLLDLRLPKIHGLEVLKRIRRDKRTKLTPVVILTTSSEENDIVNGYALGANSYIRKPIDFGEFAEAVSKVGMYWLMLNEMPPDGAVAPDQTGPVEALRPNEEAEENEHA